MIKKNLLGITCIILFGFHAQAQMCDVHPFFKEGSMLGYTHYSASGKPESKSVHTVKSVQNSGGNKTAEIHGEVLGKKDKVEHKMDYSVTCNGNIFSMDFKNLIPSEALEAYKNMEMTLEGVNLEYPDKLSVGQSLPDGKVKVKMKSSGMAMMDMEMNIVNRKVDAIETIETPAGKFDCAVISKESKMVTTTMGIPMKMNFKNKEWFSAKAGMVKSEDYSEKGKPKGYTLLTELK